MAITSDSNLTYNCQALRFSFSFDVSGDDNGPYLIETFVSVPFSVTSSTHFDAAVKSFADAIGAISGVSLDGDVSKDYSIPAGVLTSSGGNGFTSNTITP